MRGGAAGWHFDHGWHGNDGHFWRLLLVAAVLVLRQQRSNQTRRIFVSAHNSCCALWMRLLWFVWVCWHNHLSKKRCNDMKQDEMKCWPKPSPNMSWGCKDFRFTDSCESVIERTVLWKLSGRCCRIQSLKARSSCMSHVTWLKTPFWNKDSTRIDRAISAYAYVCCLYSILYSNLISIQRWSYHGKLPQDVL